MLLRRELSFARGRGLITCCKIVMFTYGFQTWISVPGTGYLPTSYGQRAPDAPKTTQAKAVAVLWAVCNRMARLSIAESNSWEHPMLWCHEETKLALTRKHIFLSASGATPAAEGEKTSMVLCSVLQYWPAARQEVLPGTTVPRLLWEKLTTFWLDVRPPSQEEMSPCCKPVQRTW